MSTKKHKIGDKVRVYNHKTSPELDLVIEITGFIQYAGHKIVRGIILDVHNNARNYQYVLGKEVEFYMDNVRIGPVTTNAMGRIINPDAIPEIEF